MEQLLVYQMQWKHRNLKGTFTLQIILWETIEDHGIALIVLISVLGGFVFILLAIYTWTLLAKGAHSSSKNGRLFCRH